jgi:two-component system phosphate regulon sensor histidine kinase PhoR
VSKKSFISSSILVFILTFFLYFAAAMSSFFVIRNNVYNACSSFTSSTRASVASKDDAISLVEDFKGKEQYKVTCFALEDQSYCPLYDSIGYLNESYKKEEMDNRVKSHPYIGKNTGTSNSYCYEMTYVPSADIYMRYGVVVPSSYYTNFYFLVVGSPLVLAVDVIYFILSYRLFAKRMLALHSQVKKLQAITNKSTPVEYEENLDSFPLMIRDARKELDYQFTELKESEQKVRFVMDSISQAIVVVDASDKIIMFNKKASETFSIPQDSADGRDLHILSSNADNHIERNLSMVVKTQIPMVYYEQINGRYYECDINPVDYSWTRVNEQNGASLLMIDVTDSYNSAKMKRDFFANASHELKSPLTSILGYQEMIKSHVITSQEDIDDAITKTVKEADRMNKIIHDMLDLSGLENEELRPIEQISVPDAIADIIASLDVEIEAKHIQMSFKPHPLVIGINPDDFDKMARNLIENAIRYNVDGGKVYVMINPNEKSLSVKDTGIGISEDNITRIFERFFRVDKARSQKNGGTGLGLAIVKYICNYYHYKIDVKSSLGSGSTFTITMN